MLRRDVLYLALCLALVGSCARRTSKISGSVRGHDGAPLIMGHVEIASSTATPGTVAQVDGDGRYSLTTETTGSVALTFSAVGYEPQHVLLFVRRRGQPMEVDVTLALPRYNTDPSKAAVIGDFNDFRNDASSIPMSPQPDGRFVAGIPHIRDNALRYQIVNVTEAVEQINSTYPGPPIPNPGADKYVRRDDGRYASVVGVEGGTATIVFEPARLKKSDAEPSVTVRSGNRETERFDALAQTLQRELKTYSRQRLDLKRRGASQERVDTFVRQYDWSRFHEPVRAELRSGASKLFKQAVMILYLGELGEVAEMSHSQLDAAIMRSALKKVPPSSPLWSSVSGAFQALTWANYHNKIDGYSRYFDAIVAKHPDPKLRESILSYDLSVSYFANDRKRTANVYERLITDFPESKSAASARKMLAPDRKVVAGKPVPPFRIAAIGDPSTVYSNETLLGRVYLVDFWGVWCAPCVAEMPYLHKAYETHKEKGFTILSLSCDPAPEQVAEFRRGRWPMPWLNGFLTNCYKNREQNDLVSAFEVVGFPSSVLVGEDGTILEIGPELRGEHLGATLARVFAEGGREAKASRKKTRRS